MELICGPCRKRTVTNELLLPVAPYRHIHSLIHSLIDQALYINLEYIGFDSFWLNSVVPLIKCQLNAGIQTKQIKQAVRILEINKLLISRTQIITYFENMMYTDKKTHITTKPFKLQNPNLINSTSSGK